MANPLTMMAMLWPAVLVSLARAHPTTMVSSAENEVTSPSEAAAMAAAAGGGNNNNNNKDVLINPLSGELQKAVGVLATITNSIEDQISMPQTLLAEEALLRMQQVRPIIDEAFHRLAQDLEKWSRQHPAESRQLFALILPAVGLVFVTVAVMSAVLLAVGYVFTSTGLTSVAGLLTGVLTGRSLPFPGVGDFFSHQQVSPEDLYNVSFWQDLDKVAANPTVLKSVFEAIDKFNKMQDEQRRQIASQSQSHQNHSDEEA